MVPDRQKLKILYWTDKVIQQLDRAPLWLLGFVIVAICLWPCLLLGQGSIFPIHDQLDETILSYVLNAKYLGTGNKSFPEILGGINASGMQPSAVLFVLLYRFLPVFDAFIIQWCIVLLSGFFGMYFCVKEITGSSILAVVTGGIFCMLPNMPVYGLSVVGVPMLLSCFLWQYKNKHILLSFLLITYFGVTTHLVLIGYVVLGLWILALLGMTVMVSRDQARSRWPWLGFCWLTAIYLAVNHSLFLELILGTGDYVSHREELVNQPMEFWETVWDVFCNSAQHAESLHSCLILPILIMLIIGSLLYRKMDQELRIRYLIAIGGAVLLLLIAVLYGFCKWQPVVNFKNSQSGFLRYFQIERFYWIYPSGWLLEFILCFSLWWKVKNTKPKLVVSPLIMLLVLGVMLFPTLQRVKVNSYLYLNVNQINNGSDVTGYISWESFYAEDLMQQLEEAIARDMTGYRVAHLGMSPVPALMHGFYTVDGYSNNYPLEYKHRFRQVIAAELEKNAQTKMYFDQWGSRCYLLNGESGNAYMLGKNQHIVYQNLEFDIDALRELDCAFLFSCGEIMNSEELGLKFRGYFETDKSFWGVWLYEL